MNEQEIKILIQQELPKILQDREMRDFVLQTVTHYFAGKQETETRFEQILEELRRDRQEQAQKWRENQQRQDRMQQQIDRMQQQIDQTLQEMKKLSNKHDSTIGALGARWGLYSEQSFRNALKGILETSFGVQVLNITEYDDQGEVFGRPEPVELDLLIKNGLLIICEIKSSMSKADMYTFERKVKFYEKRHQRQANRKMVISPMVHDRAKEIASDLNIEVYSYAEDVEIMDNG
ncbi:Protein of unknown function DUF1626 [Gloeothece citriformis PCC 7424]|uniref:DUF3782 domain-containing protein n=1 Tax=Gloeothece citriformis (strain PCC 7424) TaxID=65393 RepID=B7KA07_GLOC7|nr:DUF3782 domain-containing protein [Gloeothece citriformis]ACK71363.1 Protein of unknown function DUF1626 [Gloeothece citriformis PCC 7424]